MLFDTHCHLDAAEFDADRDAVATAAHAAGVSDLLIPAVAVGNFAAVRECCQRHVGCLPAYGIHPLYVGSAQARDLDTLQQWLRDESVGAQPPVAVGEIGLDFFESGVDRERQAFYFAEQLKIATTFSLPVVLHVRRAVDDVLKYLRRSSVRGGIAHAFNGSRQQADAFLSLGFCLGFGGAMTYPGSERIRRLAATLPLTAIVLETDAPDIPPVWLRAATGVRRNTPGQLERIARVLAELRGESMETIVTATTENAWRCLGRTGAGRQLGA